MAQGVVREQGGPEDGTTTVGQHVHFIGIAGIGVSALARVALARGYRVSGSDLATTPLTVNPVPRSLLNTPLAGTFKGLPALAMYVSLKAVGLTVMVTVAVLDVSPLLSLSL